MRSSRDSRLEDEAASRKGPDTFETWLCQPEIALFMDFLKVRCCNGHAKQVMIDTLIFQG